MPAAPVTRSRPIGCTLRAGDAVVRWWLAASAGLLIAACLLGARPAFGQAGDNGVDQLIQGLESKGRALPNQAAAELDALLPSTAEFSPRRLELLTVQGLMLAVAWQGAAAERAALQLEAWGHDRQESVPAAAAVLIRASASARAGNFQRADAMLQQAMATLPADLSARQRYRFVHTQAYIKEESGKLEDAVRLNHEALALADRQDELWRQAEARTALAGSYYQAHQLERARLLSQEALLLAEKAHDWVALARGYNTAGIVLDGLGDLPGQRRSFEQALGYARRAGSKLDEVRFLANLADFFLKTGDYKTALATAEAALPIARELNDLNSEMVALANIGLSHISMRRWDIGKRYVREAMAIDERRGSITSVADLHRELGDYLEKSGDLAGAVAAYHQHRRMSAGILQRDQQKAILAMQEQYDADRRKRELTLLNRENQIKNEQLRRGDLQTRLWGLLSAVFVLSLAVVVLLYRRVRRTNHLLSDSNEQLKVQSERDPLTGLANRRHFQAVMRQVAADGKLSGAVYLIDIDHFKRINDQHGHSAGDAVLVEVARRLRDTLREQDLIVRWGGEEFLVVTQSLASDQVETLARRMLATLNQFPVVTGAGRVSVSASIGFATFPIGPGGLRVSWERAINLVDTAMYLAKAHGRNRAYGVRLLQESDELSLDAITHSLEAAWRDGRVDLTLLQGRAALEAAA
ncbi:MAG TPA: GGDEF domain-containing protein [Burkholderiaceae bacterium]|nr:GGDEF domain-containing protein [Burkholderiaceae bacterium]